MELFNEHGVATWAMVALYPIVVLAAAWVARKLDLLKYF